MKTTTLNGSMAAVLLLACAAAPVRADSSGTDAAGPLTTTDGRQIYIHICQGCHMPQGQGAVGAGRYPALAGNPALVSWQYMALTLIKGRRNMPAFSGKHAVGTFFEAVTLDDTQIAAVINYVRTHFGNHYKDLATAAGVHALDP